MRMARVKRSEGSVTVLFVAALPLMAAALIVMVEIGRIAVARARLQAAADRAAYAGAASLADSLNRLAGANWRINKSFRDMRTDFETSSQQDEGAARQRIDRYESLRDSSLDEMQNILENMGDRSKRAAYAALEANYPSAYADIRESGEIRIDDADSPEGQRETVRYSRISGDMYLDPEGVEEGEYEALKYLVKDAGADATIGVFAGAQVAPLTASPLFVEGVDVYASAAASAYGGSIGGFALKETEDLDLAEGWSDEDGYDALYRAALVPMWSAGEENANN